ncbi:signal recognition particle-docking protein FtsY [Methanobacterium alcaliphilum]|uniref:signal recognition particle-docking protein FtsY n=1 Tax=Methanobacterium alcaliphilum TaxID=392018 RepID=UPI00200B2066|nr:signal recognition particle-docking protein FtsY [Methanobacterium alcaliphilum]MCK9152460.1 signal recognition particle-docking protein FtsY [Methanobacterium alcaliphilum]
MFDSLKKKFNTTIGKITDKVSEEAETEAQKSALSSSKDPIIEEEINSEKDKLSSVDNSSKMETPNDKTGKESKGNKSDKPGIFSFIREKTISDKDIEDILWELEMSLLESDVALEVSENIINSVKEDLIGKKIKRSSDVADYTRHALKKAVSNILNVESKNIDELIIEKKANDEPLIIMFVGINGTGKTTTIAKVSTHFIKKGYTPVIAAADTFRAGAIEQITHHAENIGVKIIKHQKGADPAAVAFDAVSHAKAKAKELVLVDTAGRMQTNINLMDEMAKIKRVSKPDLIIFVGDSLTGNDAVEQAIKFNDSVGLDGIILTKADADAKGGAALSIGYVINKPILFLGVGQSYDDLIEFKPDWMIEQLI